MSGNYITHSKEQPVTLKNESYRRSYREDDHDDAKIRRRVAGFTPALVRLKPAGKCDAGIPWYFVNGGEAPQHVMTPADDQEVRKHKEQCNEQNNEA